MIWFVLFVPAAVVLGFVASQAVLPMEYWIAFFTALALTGVLLRRRMGPKTILATAVTLSAIVLYRMVRLHAGGQAVHQPTDIRGSLRIAPRTRPSSWFSFHVCGATGD